MGRRHTLSRPTKTDLTIQYGTIAARLLRDIADGTNAPYLKAIAGVTLVIMETVETVRSNKEQCLRMSERAYELVCAVINICRDAEVELAPAMVRSINQFTDTLHKILTFLRSQVKGGFWRRVLRHMEDESIIEECNTGLKHALDVFGVQTGIIASVTMSEIQRDAKHRHQELVDILSSNDSSSSRRSSRRSPAPSRSSSISSTSSTPSLSWSTSSSSASLADTSPPTPTSDGSCSQVSIPKFKTSETNLSLMPACPKIFKGRDKELAEVTSTLAQNVPARIVILGKEGSGKTSLALSAVHQPDVENIYGLNRYFVSCKYASSLDEFLGTMSDYFGLERRSKLSKSIIRHLTSLTSPTLLVLDNLETIWDPLPSRGEVEDFLSLLADVPHLSIIVTMHGLKRPRQVRWTRPFLAPLQPLPHTAAVETFLDISDVPPDDPKLGELLALTDCHPQTITMLANLASVETCASLVTRWKKEGETMLHDEMHDPAMCHAPAIPAC